jgi:hypothetical protein
MYQPIWIALIKTIYFDIEARTCMNIINNPGKYKTSALIGKKSTEVTRQDDSNAIHYITPKKKLLSNQSHKKKRQSFHIH